MSGPLPPGRPLLLDTSVLVHFMRGRRAGILIEERLQLSTRRGDWLLSSVVEAELLLIAARRRWGDPKIAELAKLRRDFIRVSAGEPAVVQAWVELAKVQADAGEKIEQNDLWVAATARAAGAILITCDNDFLRLRGSLVRYCHIDQNTGDVTAEGM